MGESDRPIFEAEAEIEFDEPTDVAELAFVFHDVVFPESGDYRVQLLSDGSFLCERRLIAHLLED